MNDELELIEEFQSDSIDELVSESKKNKVIQRFTTQPSNSTKYYYIEKYPNGDSLKSEIAPENLDELGKKDKSSLAKQKHRSDSLFYATIPMVLRYEGGFSKAGTSKNKFMKRLLVILSVFSIFACGGNKQVDVAGISPSPFVGCWESVVANDSIQNLSVRIGERGDSLLVAFFWDRQQPFYMTGNPLSDSKGNVIPQACFPIPKSGNSAVGTIVNQYFSVFQNYPKNEYYPLTFELKSLDTLTFNISGEVNYWPASGVLVRKNSENYSFSTEVVDLYKENAFVPDADVSAVNTFDVAGITPTPFVGEWAWEKNGPWQDFSMSIAAKGDSLLLVAGGVFLGGTRMQMPDWDNDGTPLPQACLLAPTLGNIAVGSFFLDADCTVTLELFSKNTLLFKTGEQLGFWPDSAVMVRTSCDNPIFK